MPQVTPLIVLNTLIKHETLTLTDLAKEENIGMCPAPDDLQSVLDELNNRGFVDVLNDVSPVTYTITTDGITEGERLSL
ncbi:MAG: hypothetical protein JWR18_3055 [Segetibacter sp.]|jgi:hypothetical protein|nr:hypothetical protein [Segetibacter sp.]